MNKMNRYDLCNEKLFINLESDLQFVIKEKKINSITDEDNNVWVLKKILEKGGYGTVYLYKSSNNKYCDLAVKYFDNKEEMFYETDLVNEFNLKKCKNFIRMGVKSINGIRILIMEKINGDLVDLNRELKINQPEFLFSELVKFLIPAFKCAYKKGYIFIDIKLENIGYKICKDSFKFTLIDFGSFFKLRDDNPTISYKINKIKSKNDFFDNKTVFVFGVIMTLLEFKLLVHGIDQTKFYRQYFRKEKSKTYNGKKGLLSTELYQYLEEKFYSFYKNRNDYYTQILFSRMKELTKKKPDLMVFFNYLRGKYID